MSQSHETGTQRGSRIAGIPVVHTIPIDWTNHVSGTNYKVITFKVGKTAALLIRSNIIVETPDDSATSSAVSVGIASGGSTLHSAFSLKGALNTQQNNALGGAGQWIIYNSINAAVSTTGVLAIWMAVTRVGTPTAGRAYLVIEAVKVNSKKQSASQAV